MGAAALQPWITVLAGPILTLIMLGVWRYQDTTNERIKALDTKIDTKIDTLDKKIDALNKLLTENLIALNREVGEIKGASHTHVSSN